MKSDFGQLCGCCSKSVPNELRKLLHGNSKCLKPSKECPYTSGEAFANFLTHFICIPGAIVAFFKLYIATNTFREFIVVWVYSILMMTLFLVSTVYHLFYYLEIAHSCETFCAKIRPWRKFMLMMDRSAIHLFIAGCYTPWLILRDNGPLGTYMCHATWIGTITGIVLQNTGFVTRPDCLIMIYLVISILPGTFMLFFMTDSSGLALIALGGTAYMIGFFFFVSDGTVPYAHAIWHCFVNIGVFLHYEAIREYLLHKQDSSLMMSLVTHFFGKTKV